MKQNRTFSLLAVTLALIMAHAGCQPQPKPQEQKTMVSKPVSKIVDKEIEVDDVDVTKEKSNAVIEVENPVHDFGEVGPNSQNYCEFKFKNTGTDPLHIKIKTTCGCTVVELDKKEYAPGESGVIKIKFRAPTMPASERQNGVTEKHLYILSNAKNESRYELAIRAKVVLAVIVEPRQLDLSIKEDNGGAGEIILKSKDSKSFAIKSITSSGNVVSADFDSKEQATEFTVKPRIDMAMLKKTPKGVVRFNLTHPECNQVTVNFSAPSLFELSRQTIVIRNANPSEPVTKEVKLISNYGEDFEIESITSVNGHLQVLSQEKSQNNITFQVQITPPEQTGKSRYFTDQLKIKIKDADELVVRCTGMYTIKPVK